MHPTLALQAGILRRSSYYKPDYTQSAALIRARRPYLVRNTLTGIGIAGFAVAVFVFTLRAVGQEEFEDVVVPSTPISNSKPEDVSAQEGGGKLAGLREGTPVMDGRMGMGSNMVNVSVNGAQQKQ